MKSYGKFLPSKYFRGVLLSLLIGIVLIAGAYTFSQRKNSENFGLNNINAVTTGGAQENINTIAISADSDEDGLKDWEELLWKTDSENSDSDADGTNDAEEINNGRNPAVPGPNDPLPDRLLAASQPATAAASPEKLTPTDILARDFFSKYAEASQNGQTIDQLTEEQIVSSVLTHQNLVVQAKIYSENDFAINKKDDVESLRTYGNQVGAIMKKVLTWNGVELPIISEALEKEDAKKLEELNPIINGYQSFLNELLKIEIPRKALVTHVALINSISKVINSLKATKNVFNDPVSAMILFAKYPEHITSLHQAFVDAKLLFVRNNIIFDSKKDDGFLYANFSNAINAYQKR